MNAIIREVSKQQGMDEKSAWEVYRRLMRLPEVTPGDGDKMREAMEVLGKNLSAMTTDHQTLEKARALLERIKTGVGLSGAREAAAKAIADHQVETARILEERRVMQANLLAAESELGQKWMNADKAARDLRGLRQEAAALLADVPDMGIEEYEAAANKKAAAA